MQISGGEPTIHPQFLEILDAAKQRPIKHLMVNTNGVRLAADKAFAERLPSYLLQLRGADLRAVRQRALARLNELGISTTVFVTVERGVNDDEFGPIVDFALKQPCVRGVTFPRVQQAGRLEGYRATDHRLTLTEVRSY